MEHKTPNAENHFITPFMGALKSHTIRARLDPVSQLLDSDSQSSFMLVGESDFH